jgi:hypothetical protein
MSSLVEVYPTTTRYVSNLYFAGSYTALTGTKIGECSARTVGRSQVELGIHIGTVENVRKGYLESSVLSRLKYTILAKYVPSWAEITKIGSIDRLGKNVAFGTV